MCGIAGKYNFSGQEKTTPTEREIGRMLSTIRHRGPDESGLYLDDIIGMGAVRLSIVDIASGHQPLSDESGRYWIAFNGEIFNHPELRQDLERKGVRFKTSCDTEVVVQMYARYGAECLKFFNGQFALSIWDCHKKELFLARDRVGIRPLFYTTHSGFFAFCSEIKGLFALPEINRALDLESLSDVFTTWTCLGDRTPFAEVRQLAPAHFITIKAGKIKIEKYWEWNFPQANISPNKNFETIVEEFTELLTNAVKVRLRADVPVAAYLSGGLDSSVITSLIKKVKPEALNTFSIVFSDKSYDESQYQKEASAYFNTNHTAFTCTSADIAETFVDTIWHTEFPILRSAPTPMYLLSRKVRERNIKVVLTGEGSDEILAGYNIFKEAKIRRFWANEPTSGARPQLLRKLYPYLPALRQGGNLGTRLFFGYKLTDTDNPLYSHLLRWQNTSRIASFFSSDIASHLAGSDSYKKIEKQLPKNFSSFSDLAKAQYLESTIFMSGYLLSSQGDRMAMANSVEGRYPFLDFRVIEFCNALPDNLKLNCLNEKFLLKKMSNGRIPASITARTKQPYRAPIATALLNQQSPPRLSHLISDEMIRAYGIFDPKKVQTLVAKMKTTETSEVEQMAITGILSTQAIIQLFVKNNTIGSNNFSFNKKVLKQFVRQNTGVA